MARHERENQEAPKLVRIEGLANLLSEMVSALAKLIVRRR